MSVLFAFFLISGFCSLVYEVVWLRLAMASFGVTTPLVSIVLSVFMAGLAIGSWLVGRLTPRLEGRAGAALLRAYAAAELIIGLGAFTVPPGLKLGRWVLGELGQTVSWGSTGYYVASGLWITLTLLPFCICMGATYPLAMAAIRRYYRTESERSFSYLYFANVIGATTGTVAAAFFMVELFGFRGTLQATAVPNAVLAIAAWGVARSLDQRPAGAAPAPASGASGLDRRAVGVAALGLLFLTGLASMAMEMVWIRQFTPYLGTVVYAFGAILALYLAATFLGSMAYRLVARSRPAALASPAISRVWPAVGLLGLLPLTAADPRLSAVGEPAVGAFEPAGVLRLVLGITPFCGLVGFLTPMLVDRWSGGEPRRAGTAYAVNVVGCILGPLVAGFVMLPLVGERWTLLFLALPFFAIGVAAAIPLPSPAAAGAPADRPGALAPATVGAAVILAGLLLLSTRDFETVFPDRVVLRDDSATVIGVTNREGRGTRLLVNGIGMTVLTPITKMMSHLPMASLPTPPQRSLVICFGMGTTFRSLLSWGVPATAVELVPSVPALFRYYHPDAPTLVASPGARIVIDDGRRFLERTPELYDVITLDPPPPVEAAGSSLLYTREFDEIIRRRLRPGGILQHWVPGAEPYIVAAVTRALRDTFPHVRAFRYRQGWGIHFLASGRPLPATPAAELARRLPARAAADLIEWGPAATPEDQFAAVLADEVSLESLVAPAPQARALRDDRPVNEYFLLRRSFGYRGA
jgi:predicted membrane-bound spermidine synthase